MYQNNHQLQKNFFFKNLDNPTNVNEGAWKTFRNKTNAIIKKVQENYYKNIINSHSNDSKNLWKTFGNILNKNKQSHKNIVNINTNNSIIDNKQVISETFNDFFCNIGRNLANKFSNNSIEDYKTYLNNPAEQSLLLYRIKNEEIKDDIFQLK